MSAKRSADEGLRGAQRFRQRWDHSPKTVPIPAGDGTPRQRDRWLVVCPGCGRCARLQCWVGRPDVLTCTHCGFAREQKEPCELWLRVACCGHTLWARSARHLEFLESYVAATLRERLLNNWPDREYLAMLPKWLCLAKNRAAVLRGFAVLRKRLAEVEPGERRRKKSDSKE